VKKVKKIRKQNNNRKRRANMESCQHMIKLVLLPKTANASPFPGPLSAPQLPSKKMKETHLHPSYQFFGGFTLKWVGSFSLCKYINGLHVCVPIATCLSQAMQHAILECNGRKGVSLIFLFIFMFSVLHFYM